MITPSFNLTATERVLPKLALDFTTASLDSRITFTRTTSASNPATYVDSSGLVMLASNDQPRFDYDPITKVCKGLLIEEARTNLARQSEDFNTTWTKSNTTVTTNTHVAPDGTTTADTITATAANGNVNYLRGVTSGAAYAFSVFAKKIDSDTVRISFSNVADGPIFTFSSESFTTTPSGWTASFQKFDNGWYRLTASRTSNTTFAGIQFAVATSGQSVALWGAQWELGAFATSYIPTTTAALTRNADVATMTGTNFSDWFNASEGTFSTVNDHLGFSATDRFILMASTNPSGFAVNAITTRSYNTVQATTIYTGSVSQMSINSSGSLAANTIYNTVVAYKDNNSAVSRNASTASVDTSCTIPTVAALYIGGSGGSTNVMCGHVQKINYWPQRLTNAEIQAFSK